MNLDLQMDMRFYRQVCKKRDIKEREKKQKIMPEEDGIANLSVKVAK